MRVPLSWLREFVDVDLAPEALAERLTLLGMEVKGLETWGGGWHNVVVGELLAVERHPRADRLSLTRVAIGDGEPLEIVCGATNIAVGQRFRGQVDVDELAQPGERRPHRNCPRNRRSSSRKRRRSVMPCLSILIRSGPIPNAKPW